VNPDDPFDFTPDDADDRTVIRPRPGGKSPAPGARPQQQQPRPAPTPRADDYQLPSRHGTNQLESAAAPLLNLLGRLHGTPSHSDPTSLKANILEEFRAFEIAAQKLEIDREDIFWTRYVLCTAIDEAVLSTPWGNNSIWRDQSLLVTLHNEAWGGEKFFQLLQKQLQNPSRNIELLEVMYICLSFGFQGRYRPLPDGHAKLQTLNDELYRAIRNQRENYERELSIHWQGVALKQNPLVQYVPFWVVIAVSSLLLMLMYSSFSLSLNSDSDPVHTQLHNIARNVKNIAERKPAPPPQIIPEKPVITLRQLLSPQIEQQQLALEEDHTQALIRIAGSGLFASGSIKVKEAIHPLLKQIALALNQVEVQ